MGDFKDNLYICIMYSIYKLIDPNTKLIRYVGITTGPLQGRLVGHLHEVYFRKREFNEKLKWLESLLVNHQIPIIELIEETENKLREVYWINTLMPDLNMVHGTNIKFNHSYSLLRNIPVYQYDLQGNFLKSWNSASEAELELSIDNTNICSVIAGKRRKAGNFMWRAYFVDKIPDYKRELSNKEVHQYNLEGDYIRSFESARQAKGFNYKNVSQCCTGEKKTHRGYKFSFVKSLRYSPILGESPEISLQE